MIAYNEFSARRSRPDADETPTGGRLRYALRHFTGLDLIITDGFASDSEPKHAAHLGPQ